MFLFVNESTPDNRRSYTLIALSALDFRLFNSSLADLIASLAVFPASITFSRCLSISLLIPLILTTATMDLMN